MEIQSPPGTIHKYRRSVRWACAFLLSLVLTCLAYAAVCKVNKVPVRSGGRQDQLRDAFQEALSEEHIEIHHSLRGLTSLFLSFNAPRLSRPVSPPVLTNPARIAFARPPAELSHRLSRTTVPTAILADRAALPRLVKEPLLNMMKKDIANLLRKEPHWEWFADDIKVIDQTGAGMEGLASFKVLFKSLRDACEINCVIDDIVVDYVERPAEKFGYFVADWKIRFGATSPSLFRFLKKDAATEVQAATTLRLNEQNQIDIMWVDEWIVNGRKWAFVPDVAPDVRETAEQERFKKIRLPDKALTETFPGKWKMDASLIPEGDHRPALCFVNGKSGGKKGAYVKEELSKYLHPHQIVDVSQVDPEVPLKDFARLSQYCVLACGGDGTVSWALDSVQKVHAQLERTSNLPAVGVLPLGTGNDLARVTGWGKGYKGNEPWVLERLQKAEPVLIDRWTLSVNGASKGAFQNYFGIGIDASIALQYDEMRKGRPYLFFSRLLNKFWYGWKGFLDFVRATCKHFPEQVKIRVDGKLLTLPSKTRGIVILNINSYGGGSKLWFDDDMDDFKPESLSDGLFEVVALRGPAQLGKIVTGMPRRVERIAQGSHISIETNTAMPIQADGEPWIQNAGSIAIESAGKAYMLNAAPEPEQHEEFASA